MPISDFAILNNDFDDNEEYVLEMLYGIALDDGPRLLDDPPCRKNVTNL
jgi:hypothetical protein